MLKSLWLLTCVVALSVTVGVGAAAAQTVIVRNAHPGSTIELQMNAEPVRSTTADTNGDATLAVGVPAGTSESDVRFFVDVCSTLVHVQLVKPGAQPPAAAACSRNEIFGVFVMRPVTTFVVDLEGAVASIHVTQGPAPLEWLGAGQLPGNSRRYFRAAPPTGLVLFGGAGTATFSNAVRTACGDTTKCTGNNLQGATTIGAAYWISRVLGAQVSFAKLTHMTADGSGDTFRFSSTLDNRLVAVAATVGARIGPVRLYGLAGVNYHRATFITVETIDDATVVVDGVSQTLKGGTQTFEHKTQGWNWLLGGGVEAWATKSIAIYAEVQRAKLKATDLNAVEGGIDDHLNIILAGARVRLGR